MTDDKQKAAENLYRDELIEPCVAFDEPFYRPRTKEKIAFIAGADWAMEKVNDQHFDLIIQVKELAEERDKYRGALKRIRDRYTPDVRVTEMCDEALRKDG